jgi:carbamoyl-phosphate synthase large subunit
MNILLTSAGRRTYLIDYFKEAMKGLGKVYASNSVYTYSLSHADEYVLTPLIYNDDYISFLLNYCKEKKISAIISLFDIDLYVLAVNKELFTANGIQVIVADKDTIEICNDKWKTYEFLKSNNIDCPKTLNNLNDVLLALKNKDIRFPIIIKPRWGMGSIGIYTAENEEELKVLSNKVFKQIFESYLKYESNQEADKCVIFQEKINAQECGLDIFNDLNSQLITVVAKKKVSMRAGETDIAEIIENSPFLPLAKKLSEKLHHIANLDVDVFMDDSGRIYVLELNCRFGGQYPFSHLAGVNFPKQIVKWLDGEGTDDSLLHACVGITSCKDLKPVRLK